MKDISYIINHPGGHKDIVTRMVCGYSGNLIRFYIGLDEPASLINDLDQAFKKII